MLPFIGAATRQAADVVSFTVVYRQQKRPRRRFRPSTRLSRYAPGSRPDMTDTRYFYACAHEQFPPDDLLRQAVEAEQAGFDGIACSDHFQPWWEPGESGHAWVWLGAVAQATQ